MQRPYVPHFLVPCMWWEAPRKKTLPLAFCGALNMLGACRLGEPLNFDAASGAIPPPTQMQTPYKLGLAALCFRILPRWARWLSSRHKSQQCGRGGVRGLGGINFFATLGVFLNSPFLSQHVEYTQVE